MNYGEPLIPNIILFNFLGIEHVDCSWMRLPMALMCIKIKGKV